MTKYDVLCLYETKDIAMDVLKHMVDLASTCGYVTVNQYLEMSGIDECVEGGNEWGWYDKTIMDTVGVKTRCGWILDLGNPCLVTEKPKNGRYIWLSEESPNTDFIPNGQTDENVHPHRSGKYPFSYGQNMYNGILIGYAEKSIQNYIENGNLNNLKAARDILTTAIVELEDEESEEN